MSNISSDKIDDVAPGDSIAVDHGDGDPRPSKVVFKDLDEHTAVYTITFEDDDGETFQREIPAGTVVTHEMESKWESDESPTPQTPDIPE
jgi:hypothetical protein